MDKDYETIEMPLISKDTEDIYTQLKKLEKQINYLEGNVLNALETLIDYNTINNKSIDKELRQQEEYVKELNELKQLKKNLENE